MDNEDEEEDTSQRTARACDTCHSSKSKCKGDGTTACPSCIRKGVECVYTQPKKRGPKSGALKSLQEEVNRLKSELQQLREHAASSSASSSAAAAHPPRGGGDRGSDAAAPAAAAVAAAGSKRGRGREAPGTGSGAEGRPPPSARPATSSPPYGSMSALLSAAGTQDWLPTGGGGGGLARQERHTYDEPAAAASSRAAAPLTAAQHGVQQQTQTQSQHQQPQSLSHASVDPGAAFVPIQSEPPICLPAQELRFVRLYMLFCNPLQPMVCKQSYYSIGLRLGMMDLICGLCEDTRPVCDHARGDCSGMAFVGLADGQGTPPSSLSAAAAVAAAAGPVRLSSGSGGRVGAAPTAAAPDAGASFSAPADAIRVAAVRLTRPAGRATPALIAAHKAQMTPEMRAPRANSPRVLCAAKAVVYGVLAIGARMDGALGAADAYISRCRASLSGAWDEPCLETIQALLLLGFYIIGVSAHGDMLRAKCAIGLANEMADGLEISAAAMMRRSATNAFSSDAPADGGVGGLGDGAVAAAAAPLGPPPPSLLGGARRAPTASGGTGSGSSSSGDSSAGVALGMREDSSGSSPQGLPLDILISVRFLAQLTSAYRSNPSAAPPAASAAAAMVRSPAAQRRQGLGTEGGGEAVSAPFSDSPSAPFSGSPSAALPAPSSSAVDSIGRRPSSPSSAASTAALLGGLASSNNSRGDNSRGVLPSSSRVSGGPPDGAPVSGSGISDGGGATKGPAADEWGSPRGRVSKILAYVTMKTRRRVSSPSELRRIAPGLLAALVDAEAVQREHGVGGAMSFTTDATIHTSRAVVLHACGDTAAALRAADAAIRCMTENPALRRYANFMTTSIFVQLIPVVIASGGHDRVGLILAFLGELSALWPVGQLLLSKAQRRISYCYGQQAAQAAGASPEAAARQPPNYPADSGAYYAAPGRFSEGDDPTGWEHPQQQQGQRPVRGGRQQQQQQQPAIDFSPTPYTGPSPGDLLPRTTATASTALGVAPRVTRTRKNSGAAPRGPAAAPRGPGAVGMGASGLGCAGAPISGWPDPYRHRQTPAYNQQTLFGPPSAGSAAWSPTAPGSPVHGLARAGGAGGGSNNSLLELASSSSFSASSATGGGAGPEVSGHLSEGELDPVQFLRGSKGGAAPRAPGSESVATAAAAATESAGPASTAPFHAMPHLLPQRPVHAMPHLLTGLSSMPSSHSLDWGLGAGAVHQGALMSAPSVGSFDPEDRDLRAGAGGPPASGGKEGAGGYRYSGYSGSVPVSSSAPHPPSGDQNSRNGQQQQRQGALRHSGGAFGSNSSIAPGLERLAEVTETFGAPAQSPGSSSESDEEEGAAGRGAAHAAAAGTTVGSWGEQWAASKHGGSGGNSAQPTLPQQQQALHSSGPAFDFLMDDHVFEGLPLPSPLGMPAQVPVGVVSAAALRGHGSWAPAAMTVAGPMGAAPASAAAAVLAAPFGPGPT